MEKSDPADVDAIKSVHEQLSGPYMARDLNKFLSSFTDDFVGMPPDEPPIIGKDAWHSWLSGWWDLVAVEQATGSSEEIVVAGDWAFERHYDSAIYTSKASGEAQHRYFKGIFMLRKQADGSWKIARYCWNTNPPPAANTQG